MGLSMDSMHKSFLRTLGKRGRPVMPCVYVAMLPNICGYYASRAFNGLNAVPCSALPGTVKTSMDHPSQGKTQMFRRDMDSAQFESVMDNPRSHTGHGYQTTSSPYYNSWKKK